MIPGSNWITMDSGKIRTMDACSLDEVFQCWDPMVDYSVNAPMKAKMMNPALAIEPQSERPQMTKQLEMPMSGMMLAGDAGVMYGYVDDYPQGAVYSPTQSYSSSTSTDNERSGSLDSHPAYMGQLQSPTVSEISGMNNSPLAPYTPPLAPRTYKPCVVCSDKSSGYHYTVSSCEGCKGFFRRSIQKNMQYTCHKDQNCEINKVTRNRCQFCRLRKCLGMGMSKEAVRNDRKKKRHKTQESPTSSSASQRADELTERDRRLIDTILSAHRATFPDRDDDIVGNNGFVRGSDSVHNVDFGKIIGHEIDVPDGHDVNNKVTDMILWGRVSELSVLGIERIVKFAKRVPGFLELTQSDKITLLKAAALEIIILRMCLRYDLKRDVMAFACGMVLNRFQITVGGFGSLTEEIFKLAASFKKLEVDVTMIAILTAVCLVSGDRSGLEDTASIETAQEPLVIALDHYVSIRFPLQPRLLAKLLIKLTDLRKISIEGAEQVLKLSTIRQFSPILEELLHRAENVDLNNPERLSADMDLPPEMSRPK